MPRLRLTPRWLAGSVRHKLLAMALLPLMVVLPLLVGALLLWGDIAYDRLLITKVRSDLAVARGYFNQVVSQVGGGTQSVAASHALVHALTDRDSAATARLLEAQRVRLDLDFLVVLPPHAAPVARVHDAAHLEVMDASRLLQLAPALRERVGIALLPTRNAAPSERRQESRAMVLQATAEVRDEHGALAGYLTGGVLLNQNLPFIDHINRIVYPEGSLPFGSQGTATLFLDDVRITTNVRLFQGERAIGTRVSQAVREAVLGRGSTWLDRAYVVNDWYVSAYEPLTDAGGQRVGMLYVGFLEEPFRWVKYAMLGVIGVIFMLVTLLAAAFSLRLARGIFHPVEAMNDTMHRVERGETTARVGPVNSSDEIGALAAHLDQLLDVIDDKTGALQRWAGELDAKVAERTRELAASNASLRQAQQQLVRSEKLATIGQLTASVAHEINNPIAVIQGNLDLIRETLGQDTAPVRSELRLIDDQVDRMRLIVTQLLQHARPTEYAGYVEPLEVNGVIEQSLVLVSHLLARSRIDIVRDLQATRRAGFNRQELQQILINLVINAIQAMREGGRLTLRTLDDPAEAGVVCIEIEDTGPGLSDRVRENLFRPFFTTRNDGNGLGLWISRGLVERYGGTLEAGDGADGALFRLRLFTEPLPPVQDSAPAPLRG